MAVTFEVAPYPEGEQIFASSFKQTKFTAKFEQLPGHLAPFIYRDVHGINGLLQALGLLGVEGTLDLRIHEGAVIIAGNLTVYSKTNTKEATYLPEAVLSEVRGLGVSIGERERLGALHMIFKYTLRWS